MPLASSSQTAMYGLRPPLPPPLDENVQATVAFAALGSALLVPALAEAVADALALEVADAVALVAEGLALAAALQPTTPAMAASDRPPRKARRVTSE